MRAIGGAGLRKGRKYMGRWCDSDPGVLGSGR